MSKTTILPKKGTRFKLPEEFRKASSETSYSFVVATQSTRHTEELGDLEGITLEVDNTINDGTAPAWPKEDYVFARVVDVRGCVADDAPIIYMSTEDFFKAVQPTLDAKEKSAQPQNTAPSDKIDVSTIHYRQELLHVG